jgi:hypothetical protein
MSDVQPTPTAQPEPADDQSQTKRRPDQSNASEFANSAPGAASGADGAKGAGGPGGFGTGN